MSAALKIIPAGAGSGKTFRIKSDLVEWVRKGEVAPHRILAVTFTEAAAGELKDRIRASLLAEGMVEEALGVERSYVSTIHGLGLRILTEHAFAAQSSPSPRLLSDGERDLLIRRNLAESETLAPMRSDPERFGYKPALYAGKSAADSFRETLFRTIDLLRGLGETGQSKSLITEALRALRAIYGTPTGDPALLKRSLQDSAQALLDAFPEGGLPFADENKTAQTEFREQLAWLRQAARGKELDHDWSIWEGLRSLRLKIRRSSVPEELETLSNTVMAAAEGILHHPGPLDAACQHLENLVGGAQDIIAGYGAAKREFGVIDFADMIVDAERLLRTEPLVLQSLIDEIDCVIIDEFQDTNPIQFALLWRLATAAPRVLLVGDTKQSIMGFQGADPRLTEALVSQRPAQSTPLDKNWRSDPRLMALINAISSRLFKEYVPLRPQRRETGQPFLEVLSVEKGRAARKPNARPQDHVAARIQALLEEKTPIVDRSSDIRSAETRPVRPGDIAILCRTNSQAGNYAEKLTAVGIPVRISGDGWLQSPAIIVARNAIAFAADPADGHAALCLLTLGPEAMPLQVVLEQLLDGLLFDHPALAALKQAGVQMRTATVTQFVRSVVDAAGMREWVRKLPDGAQGHADLVRLEHEAEQFETAHRDMKSAAGFYGETAQTFIGWLESRLTERNFNRHPDPSGDVAEGVEIVTWHASKGREWNITFVVGLDEKIAERPGSLRAEFDNFDNLDNVLTTALLRYTPDTGVKEKTEAFVEASRPHAEAEAKRLLYVALTRARDRLILEWPEFHLKNDNDGNGPDSYARMLVDEANVAVGEGAVQVAGVPYPARLIACPDTLELIPTAQSDAGQGRHRFGDLRSLASSPQCPWRVRPSEASGDGTIAPDRIDVIDLGTPVDASNDSFAAANERGSAWHLVFRTAFERTDRLVDACNAAKVSLPVGEQIAAQAMAVKTWLLDQGYDRFHLELPIQLEDERGAQTNAVVDLLALSDTGALVLDHKSSIVSDPKTEMVKYVGQLQAYTALITASEITDITPVTAINWMRAGAITCW